MANASVLKFGLAPENKIICRKVVISKSNEQGSTPDGSFNKVSRKVKTMRRVNNEKRCTGLMRKNDTSRNGCVPGLRANKSTIVPVFVKSRSTQKKKSYPLPRDKRDGVAERDRKDTVTSSSMRAIKGQ